MTPAVSSTVVAADRILVFHLFCIPKRRTTMIAAEMHTTGHVMGREPNAADNFFIVYPPTAEILPSSLKLTVTE